MPQEYISKKCHITDDFKIVYNILSPLQKCAQLCESQFPEHINMQEIESIDESSIEQEIQRLLPEVHSLKRNGQYEIWQKFTYSLSMGSIPPNNIAFQLFQDVMEFYNNKSSYSSSFSDNTKKFWALGYRLFRGKFICFMGGYKSTTDSNINFIVPDIKILQKEIRESEIECKEPGVIFQNIQSMSSLSGTNEKSYKICMDGKKISCGFGKRLGEVDLFGHETQPKKSDKEKRFNTELATLEKGKQLVTKIEEKGHLSLEDAIDDDRENLAVICKDTITILTIRVKELHTHTHTCTHAYKPSAIGVLWHLAMGLHTEFLDTYVQ